MSMQLMSDKQLVNIYVDGEERALNELLRRYKDKIFTAIYLFVKNQALAEDIFQDTFVKVIDSLRRGKYYEDGKFYPWVARIAHNLCIDHYRKNKRSPVIDNKDEYDIFDMIKRTDVNGEQIMIKEQAKERVRKLIDALPPEQREVVILRHYAELSFKEISKMTNVSINTALGRMRYALINMRKMIEEKNIVL